MASSEMNFGAAPTLFEYAKALRNKPTAAEAVLWHQLKNNGLDVKI